jgi:hypothetical protein
MADLESVIKQMNELLGTDATSPTADANHSGMSSQSTKIFDGTPDATPAADHSSGALRTDGTVSPRASAAIGDAAGVRSHAIGATVLPNTFQVGTSTLGKTSYAIGDAIGNTVTPAPTKVVNTPLSQRERPATSVSRVEEITRHLRQHRAIAVMGPGADVSGRPPRDNDTLAKGALQQWMDDLAGVSMEAKGTQIVRTVEPLTVGVDPAGFGMAPPIERSAGVSRNDRDNYGLAG